jgi:hypothetical protein
MDNTECESCKIPQKKEYQLVNRKYFESKEDIESISSVNNMLDNIYNIIDNILIAKSEIKE